jgi:hypothetical protein
MPQGNGETVDQYRLRLVEERSMMLDERTKDVPGQIKSMSDDIGELKEAARKGNTLLFQLILAVLGVALSIVASMVILVFTGALAGG